MNLASGASSSLRGFVAAAMSLAFSVLVLAACGPEKATAPAVAESPKAPSIEVGGRAPDIEAAKALFQSKGCVACHVVTGVPGAVGTVGPSLDGLASRSKLAAGLPVTAENVAKWIRDPASIKPGTVMPKLGLSDSEINTLVAWLMTLK